MDGFEGVKEAGCLTETNLQKQATNGKLLSLKYSLCQAGFNMQPRHKENNKRMDEDERRGK